MKNSRRTVQRVAYRWQTAQRRRLLVEQLEARDLLCQGFPPAFYPPPDSYRSANVSDYVAQVAYEFDLWLSEPIIRDFRPTNCEAVVRDGRMLVEAIAVDSGAELVGELTAIDAVVVGSYEWLVSAWVPLVRLTNLKDLQELRFAKLLYDHTMTNQPAAELSACGPLSSVSFDTAGNVLGNLVESSQSVDLPAVAMDDYSDIPAQYHSPRVSDLLARAALEFSQRPSTVPASEFVASDPWVTVIHAVSTSIVGEKLGEALTDIGGEVLGSFGPAVNAWFPLERILELGELVDLTFASPVLDVVW